MNKKVTAILAAVFVAAGVTFPVYAGETESSGEVTEETGSITCGEEEDSYTGSSIVDYAQSSTFTVSVPKSVTLSELQKNEYYSVSVSGDIASDESVWVIPCDMDDEAEGINFLMTDTGEDAVLKEDVLATVTQPKTAWNSKNVATSYASTDNLVTAQDLSAGTWEGTLYFDISLHKHSFQNGFCGCGESNLDAYTAGLYDSYGNQLVTWDDLVNTYGLDIESDAYSVSSQGTFYSLLAREDFSDIGQSGTELVIPSGITRIGNFAFMLSKNLQSIVIPDTVTAIGMYAFNNCTSLASITIPDSVTSTGSGIFINCTSLTSVHLSSALTIINTGTFQYCSSLTNVVIPENVQTINGNAFVGCSSLQSVSLPKGLTKIGNSVFISCTSLRSVSFPEVAYTIGNDTFTNCQALTELDLSNAVEIGDYSFRICRSLKSVKLSSALTSIGTCAFYGDTSLTLYVPNSVQTIGESAFSDVKHVYYNGSASGAPWNAAAYNEGGLYAADGTLVESWDDLLADGLTPYVNLTNTKAGVLIDGTEGCLRTIMYENDSLKEKYKNVTTLVIPAGNKTYLGDWIFYQCQNLTKVVIPDNICWIGTDTFRSCSNLQTVVANNLQIFCYESFYECTALSDIDLSHATDIRQSAFTGCISLQEIALSDSLQSIGSYTFSGCKNATITVPSTVTSIGGNAFKNVPQIYYEGDLTSDDNWGALALN